MSQRTLLFSAAFFLFAASAVHAGPPWISIELPANPHHASTRGATLMVRAYHHSTSLNMPVRGTAEGIVDGRRVSLPLDITATNQSGVFALKTPLPKGGTWILAITATQGEEATATALVTVDGAGRIVDINVPSNKSRDGWSVPRRVEQREIENALRAAHVATGGETDTQPAFAFALPLLRVGVAAALARRRQTSV